MGPIPKSALPIFISFFIALSFIAQSARLAQSSQQTLRTQIPVEQLGTPREAPEPTRKLTRHPQELFNVILSANPETQLQSLSELVGEDLSQESIEVGSDAQIRAVQLDDDPEPELIVVVHVEYPPHTRIVVTDRTPEGWNVVGNFNYWYFWDRESAEKALEVHLPFIIVRETSGGSGLLMVTATLFRLWKGKLYKTVELEESMEVRTIIGSRPPRGEREQTQIDFLWEGSFRWKIRIRTEKETTFIDVDRGETVGAPVISRWCLGYEWVPATFSFELTQSATQALCK